MRKLGCLLVLVVACAVPALLYTCGDHILPSAANWLDVGEPAHCSDYLFVLGGDINVRPYVAAKLFKAGLAKKVLVSRVRASPEIDSGILPPHHEVLTRVLVYRGVPRADIELLGRDNDSTFDEARWLAAFVATRPEVRITVVTTNCHTRRAQWIFSQVLGKAMDRVWFVSTPAGKFRPENWWRNEEGFSTVLGENLKLAFYVFRYSHLAYWLGAVLLALTLLVVSRRWNLLSSKP